jgi:hypothetical protein
VDSLAGAGRITLWSHSIPLGSSLLEREKLPHGLSFQPDQVRFATSLADFIGSARDYLADALTNYTWEPSFTLRAMSGVSDAGLQQRLSFLEAACQWKL